MANDGKLSFDTGIDTNGFQNDVGKLISLGSQAATAVTSVLTDTKQTAGKIGSEFAASMSQVSAAINSVSDTSAFDLLSSAATQASKHISDGLNGFDIKVSDLKTQLSQIDKSLQLNPGNTELLSQKFTALGQQISAARERLDELKNAEAEVTESFSSGKISLSQYDAYRREILNTEAALRSLISAQEDVKTELTITVAPQIDIPDIGTVLNEKISQILNNSSAEIGKLDEQLSEINKSLQLNPGNTELLGQKFAALGQQISVTRDKLTSLRNIEEQVNQSFSNGEISTEQYDAYRRSVLNAEASLRQLIDAQNDMVDESGNLRNVSNEVKNLDDALDDAGQSAITFGDLLKSNIAGELITEGLRKAADAVKSFVGNGIELASDLQEVQNVVDVTFGDGAAQIYEWSDAAAESFGMSSLSAQNYNGTLGAMLKSMGIADEAVIKMSTDMVGLAGDMASFYNLDVEQAFEKIRSGISGETEPLKQLGINMSVANLEAYALSQGIETAYEKMSQSEQAILRYNYLMSVTADAQGDFARTSDSFANQQRILQLNIENLSASFGEKLLPSLNEAFDTANEKLPRLENTVENIGEVLGKVTSFALEHHEAILGLVSAYLTYKGAMKAGKEISDIVGAFKNLTTATQAATTAQQGMNAAAMANPYVVLAAAIAAVTVGLVSLVSAAGDASKSLKETAEESIEEYENQKEKVSELETELENVRDRITEIQSKGKLNFTDTEELTNLQLQNQELSTQLEIEKELLEAKKKQAEYDLYNTVFNEDTSEKDTVAYVENQIENYKSALDGLEYWQEQLDEAIKNKDESAEADARIGIQQYEEALNEDKLNILEGITAINELAENLDYTTEKGQQAKEEIDGLNGTVREMFDIAEEEPTLGINMEVHGESSYARDLRLAYENSQNEKKIRDENLKDFVANLDERLVLRRINEDQYYSDLKNYLEIHTDTESKAWYEQLGRYEDYEQKKLDAAKKESEEEKKIAKEAAEKEKQARKDKWDNITRQEQVGLLTEKKALAEREKFFNEYYPDFDPEKDFSSDGYEYFKQIYDDKAKLTKKASEEEKKEFKDKWDNITRQEQIGLLTEKKALEEHRKLFNESFPDFDPEKDCMTEAFEYYKKIYTDETALTEEEIKKQEKIVDDGLSDILKRYQKAYDDLDKKRENYRKKLLSIGGDIFSVEEKEDKNGNKTKTYTVNNIDEQIKKMREYHKNIKELKKQGISDSLLEELTSMNSEDSAQFAKYLSGMSGAEFKKINDLYAEKDAVAEELSNDLYKSEAEKISENMSAELAAFAVSAYDYGAQSAEQFSKGFNEKMDELGINDILVNLNTSGADAVNDAAQNQQKAAAANKNYENSSAEKASFSQYNALLREFKKFTEKVEVSAGSSAKGKGSLQSGGKISDVEHFIKGINKPVKIYLNDKEIAETVINYQDKKSRKTGG